MDVQNEAPLASGGDSLLDEETDWELARKLEELWLYEDDHLIGEMIDKCAQQTQRARDLFFRCSRENDFIWCASPTDAQSRGCAEIDWRFNAIFDHEIEGQPDSLLDRARQICSLRDITEDGHPEFSDAHIFACLALSALGRATHKLYQICVLFQEEVRPFIGPLSVLREMHSTDYFVEATKLRKKIWRDEQELLVDACEYRVQAEKLMALSVISSDGVLPHRVADVADRWRGEGVKEGRDEWTRARKGAKSEKNCAIESLAREWSTFTAATFLQKLKECTKNGPIECVSTGGKLWVDALGGDGVRYVSASGQKDYSSSGALKKVLDRM